VEAADGEVPSCFHAFDATVFSEGVSGSDALLWCIFLRIDFVSFSDAVWRQFRHELDEVDGVVVILVDEVSYFGRDGEE